LNTLSYQCISATPVPVNFSICISDRNRAEFLENLMGNVRHLGMHGFPCGF